VSKVFIGGSRRITRLSAAVTERLDNIVSRRFDVLIGDANGADKAVQAYLATKQYGNVVVFCMGTRCRNNVGDWKARNVFSDVPKRDFRYYSTKDLRMAEEASYGFMLWDGKSKGTLNNVINLLKQSKKVLVYYSPSKEFLTVGQASHLTELLRKCDKRVVEHAQQRLGVLDLLPPEPAALSLVSAPPPDPYGSSGG